VFLAAATRAGRRAADPAEHGGTGAADLAVICACPAPGCRAPGPVASRSGGDNDPGLPWAACQRALRPGGLLAVITTAVWHPGWAGQLIAHARAAGLMYAQHVIALHAALSDDRLLSPPAPQPGAPAAASPADTRHLPVHTDLLLFAQRHRPAQHHRRQLHRHLPPSPRARQSDHQRRARARIQHGVLVGLGFLVLSALFSLIAVNAPRPDLTASSDEATSSVRPAPVH